MLKAGNLNHRLEFHKKVDGAADALGNTERVWEKQFTTSAELHMRTGGEAVTQARLSGRNVAMISVRRNRDTSVIDAGWKAVDARSGVEWNIRSVMESFDGSSMELLAESGVPV